MYGLALPDYLTRLHGYDVTEILEKYFPENENQREMYFVNGGEILKLKVQDAFKFKKIREAVIEEWHYAKKNELDKDSIFGTE